MDLERKVRLRIRKGGVKERVASGVQWGEGK